MQNVDVSKGYELTPLVIACELLIDKAFAIRCALFEGTQVKEAKVVVAEEH